ncbi:ATP-binding protein [Tropicibacter naphthalenivorans]|uniref:histidine kinase n=1 Tax=Tropicibacter naphthalenivorans TaxID=441103 RepID=A0A0P1G7G3_9RHOB|nr:ATP-binding protein [Tropicibacter naphthalenivorans]CUH77502.1 Osmolarity sensor protein EnvZ [Tropicibacter naphthalenivorans]SMC56777.1 two-component system, OmpR family, osmolarity sensor histidine kinase EnvZ [Tropicibacter naphthalenivorans]
MSFEWLKQYMPRSLYGRAALILVLPVVTLQLVVSVVFIQRHFEGVTEQLTRELSRAVNLTVSSQPDPLLMNRLNVPLVPIPEAALPEANFVHWYDLSGLVVIRELSETVEGLERIELPTTKIMRLYIRHEGVLYLSEVDRRRASAASPHQLLVNMLFFGVLMTLIAYLYLRNQLRPITRLAHAAEAFGRGRTEAYSPSGAIEVRAAGHAFLDMRARIERHIEQRTMMLSGVSHDLRTPITRLRLGLSLLDDEDREPLEKDVEEMQRLIDAFLDFARGEAETAVAEPTDPVALVQEIVGDAQRAGQAVKLGEITGQATVGLRPRALRRAIENLIGNAVRYGNHAVVSVTLTERSLRIRVEDDGPGIPPEDRDNALRPFVRLDPARNQDRGSGVGLGLAIAADIARAHGGVLRLGSSDSLGGLRADIVIAL